ncbi:hypothetical protein CSUI_005047, partial [Cystoisospora suis]
MRDISDISQCAPVGSASRFDDRELRDIATAGAERTSSDPGVSGVNSSSSKAVGVQSGE